MRSRPRCPLAAVHPPAAPPLHSRRRAWLGSLVLVAGLVGCGGDAEPAAPTAAVERGVAERIVVATGTIEPATEVEVRPRIAGIIEHIAVEAGDEVEEGQLLVQIERDLIASQVREAEAAVAEAKVEERYAGIDLRRAEELVRNGARSAQQLDTSKARAERAAARVNAAEARFETLSTQLGYASVVSPLTGRVLDVHTEEGSAVSPVTAVTGGTLLLSLAGTDTLHLEGLVDENEVARVVVGQPVRIRTEAFGDGIFQGHVREIAPLGQRVQNVTYFEVEIEITDPDAKLLRPRMSGDAEIVTEVVEEALLIPETALRYRGDTIFVQIPNGDGTETRNVKVGVVDGDRVQVLEGLTVGEEVVLQ